MLLKFKFWKMYDLSSFEFECVEIEKGEILIKFREYEICELK